MFSFVFFQTKLTFWIVWWTFLTVWTTPVSFSCHFFHICKLVNEIICNPKWFVNNCFTDACLTEWNFQQRLQFTNALRPVNFNKYQFSILLHFNRLSATVLNKVMSIQIHMLCKIKHFLLKTYVSSLEYLKLSKKRVCRVVSLLKCYFNRVAMQFCWDHISAWVFFEFAPYFQGISLWEDLNLFFIKALLSLIAHFKGTIICPWLADF